MPSDRDRVLERARQVYAEITGALVSWVRSLDHHEKMAAVIADALLEAKAEGVEWAVSTLSGFEESRARAAELRAQIGAFRTNAMGYPVLTPWQLAELDAGKCPDCGSTEWLGSLGAATSVNFQCVGCGSQFNITPVSRLNLRIYLRISEPSPDKEKVLERESRG